MTDSFDSLFLVETTEHIVIHPADPALFNTGDRFIVIDRITEDVSISTDRSLIPVDAADRIRKIEICGVIGVIRLVAGPYLVVIKSSVRVGELKTHVIWQLKEFEVIPFKKTLLHISAKQKQYNSTYLEMLNTVLSTPNFYFSHTYDLSRNMQSQDLKPPDVVKQTLVERVESKYVWNTQMLDTFHGGRVELHKFCVPMIHGFVGGTVVSLNAKQFKFILISRRSSKRPGTRLFSRGIDMNGNVSNDVETEQILEHRDEMTSFVQIRGSIPLFWTQRPNLKYKPKLQLAQLDPGEAYIKHYADLIMRYGKVVSVNLVNQKGAEGELEQAFRNQSEASSVPKTRYEAFYFQRECPNLNWNRLDILTNRLNDEIEEFGYFIPARAQRQRSILQEGVFRTNCIDCLDRTNVVQGLLAKVNMEHVLKKIKIFRVCEKLSDHRDFEHLFKNIWADNGELLSIQYSGTGSLNTDFTRTGERTRWGVLCDNHNSSIRYLKNNFNDGYRQDAMDLFVGNYMTNEKEGAIISSPLEKNHDWKYLTLPILLLISMVMWTSLVLFPQEYSPEYLLYNIIFWGSMSFAMGGVIVYYGTEFVDNPVLADPPRLTM